MTTRISVLGAIALLLTSSAAAAQRDIAAWYEAVELHDLTGDGLADTLLLRAQGNRADSLNIVFTIRSLGTEIYRTTWTSQYELVDPPFDIGANPAATDSLVRARLERFFERLRIQPVNTWCASHVWGSERSPYCGEDARSEIAFALKLEALTVNWRGLTRDSAYQVYRNTYLAPVDTATVLAIWRDILEKTRYELGFSYGYETSTTIAWSSRAGRFFTLSSCC